ncbi:MAG: tetratricopeptide repeat protein [Ignavibacteriaceae bacterium]|nr:tetratricopeptide repeat protein [Ignavibacteriaceae bacterium]
MVKILCFILIIIAGAGFSQNFNDDNNRYILGENYEQSGYPEKAKEIYEDLYNRNTSNFQYFISLNRIYVLLKQYESSVKLLEQRLSISPQDINIYGLLGSTYYLMGNETKAYSTWEDGLTKLSPNALNYRLIANYAIERRDFEKAIDFLKRGKKISDDPVLFSFDLANLYSLTMQYKDAAEEYLFIIQRKPDQYPAVQARILSYIDKVNALQTTIDVFERKRDDENINMSHLLASLYMQGKMYDKAFDIYSEIDSKIKSNGVTLLNFAQDLYNEKQYEMCIKVFREIISKYPSSPIISSAKLGYAETLEANLDAEKDSESNWRPYSFNKTGDPKKVNEIISAFNEIVKIYPQSEQAQEALLRIGILKNSRLNDSEGAKEILDQLLKQGIDAKFLIKSYEELGDIYLEDGNLDKSKEMFQKLIQTNSIPEEEKNYARYKEARISFYEGNFPIARNLLQNIISKYKDNNSNDALELSLVLNTMMNDSSNLVIFANAELLSEQKKFSEAREKYLIIAQNPQAFVLQSLAKLRMAEMDLAMDNYDSSMKVLQEIVDEKEKNIYSDKALYLQGNIYQFAKKDSPKAIEIYESLLAKFPNSIYLDDARARINKLKNKISQRPEWQRDRTIKS